MARKGSIDLQHLMEYAKAMDMRPRAEAIPELVDDWNKVIPSCRFGTGASVAKVLRKNS